MPRTTSDIDVTNVDDLSTLQHLRIMVAEIRWHERNTPMALQGMADVYVRAAERHIDAHVQTTPSEGR
jgi:hypothetical protein